MNNFVDSFAYWLADFHLWTTMLLLMALAALSLTKQPAMRVAITKSALLAVLLMVVLCATPGWSFVHLAMPRPAVPQPTIGRESTTAVQNAIATVPQPAPRGPIPLESNNVLPAAEPRSITITWRAKLLVAYGLGSSVILIWLILGAVAARRLLQETAAAPAAVQDLLKALWNGENRPSLRVSERIDVAVALGTWRPTILLPSSWVTKGEIAELRSALAHECAHVANGDVKWVALGRLVSVALWAQPLFWLVRRRMRLDQEALADAAAAELTNREGYAEQLVVWARGLPLRKRTALASAVGLWESPSQLRRRITILLDDRLTVLRSCPRMWWRLAVGFGILAAFALSFFSLAPDNGLRAKLVAEPPGIIAARIQHSLAEFPSVKLKSGPCTIEGRCEDGEGHAVASVHLALFYNNFTTRKFGLVRQATSDATGAFRFENLEVPAREEERTVTYWVIAWSAGRASAITNVIPERPRVLTFKMPAARAVTGRVTDGNGAPVAGAIVRFDQVLRAPIEGVLTARTDANGDFAVTDLCPLRASDLEETFGNGVRQIWTPRFNVEHPNFATASVRYQEVPSDVNVVLQPPATIRGRVIYGDGARSAIGAQVMLQCVDQHNLTLDDAGATQWAETTTDDQGQYQLNNLGAGTYNVWATAPDWTVVALDSFEMKTGETREAPDLVLTTGGFLAGRLVNASTGEGVSVGDEFVSVGVYGPSRPRSGAAIDGGRVERDGSYRFRLPAGQHYVYLSGRGPFAVVGSENGARDVVIRDGETTETEFRVRRNAETQHSVLGPALRSKFVAGNPAAPWAYKPNVLAFDVQDEAGTPVGGVEALVYRTSLHGGQLELVTRAKTNELGEVKFGGLVSLGRPADYRSLAAVSKNPSTSSDTFIVVLRHPGLGTIVLPASEFEVAVRGNRRGVRMRPAAELSGRVTDRAGKPVAGATVAAGSLAGIFAIEGANAVMTDANGHYRFTDLIVFDRKAASEREAKQNVWALKSRRNDAESHPAVYDPAEDTTVSDLYVAHPDFAVTTVRGGDVPGETNVVMKPAAAIEGRVVEFATGKPAAGIQIKANGTLPSAEPDLKNTPSETGTFVVLSRIHQASTRTDEDGRYRLSNLPAGRYDVWAEEPTVDWSKFAWVSRGVSGIQAVAGERPTKAPELVIGPGATIYGQLIDAATGKRLLVGEEGASVRASFFLGEPQSEQNLPMQRVNVSTDGKFVLRAVPGALRVFLMVDLQRDGGQTQGDYRSDDDVWKTGRLFDLKHGESVDADFRVWPYARIEELRAKSVRGFELLNAGKHDAAIKVFDEILAVDPSNTSALQGRGQALERAGRVTKAIADYEAAIKVGDTGVMWHLADLLATSPDANVRNGRRAVELATQVLEVMRRNPPNPEAESMALGLLAAAQAENGDFDAAAATQREAIERAPAGRREDMRERLKLYEARKPYRGVQSEGRNS